MEYRVLGRLEVLRDGELIDLGPHRQRSLLAILLTKANAVVSMDEIIDALWGEDGAADKQNALWVYVSGLRKALDPARQKRTDGTVLLTRSPGYLLATAADDELDSARFENLVAEGRSLTETDPAAASLVLGEALALWRGKPYEEFTYDSFFQDEIARLESLRIEAVEARIDADLKRGMSRELVAELEGLVREHPLRERLTGQLMLALYRSGRQAESLRAFGALRVRLGEELGIEPSTSIRKLEEQIVLADDSLETIGGAALAGAETEPGLAIRGYELREKIGEGAFGIAYRAYQPAVGREVAIKVIRPEYADDPAFIRRFEAEAQLVARLEHPHIVPLYDYWREPGAAYLVMRLMRGGSLDHVLETSALTTTDALRVTDQVASALQTAHGHGVVHRDIKPSNILIDDDGNAYLSDFGIAIGPGRGPSGTPSISGTLAAPYASPEQLSGSDVAPSSDVYSLAVVLAQAVTGLRGDVAQIRGALDSALVSIIDKATSGVVTDRYPDAPAFADALRRSIGDGGSQDGASRPRVEVENPYKGLRSFDAADSGDFFGRERLVDRLLYRLGEHGVKGRFVTLIGPSGSGKSSVIKAGLLPAILGGALPTSERWFVASLAPAPHPFEELESALLSVAVDPPELLLERLTARATGLHEAVRGILPDDESQLVLVVDQFEELFTQVEPETADRFIDSLVAAVTASNSRLRIVATLRADFYDRPLRHRALGELLRDGTEVITPMSADELERAISGPAEHHGVVFEPALIARLIADVSDRPSVLPLLQYALTELFESRKTSRITVAAYDDLGGVSGAMVKRADGLLAGLSTAGQQAARLVLLRLVTLGEGSEDTRRRVLLSELESLAISSSDRRAVLDTFGRHRLLSFDRDPVTRSPTVEIAHETMLTEWRRLRDWIDDARQDVRNQRRLAESMAEWASAGRKADYLLRGGRLEQLHGWAATTSLPLSTPEQAFLDASTEERERVEQDELDRSRRVAAAEAREQQRVRQLIGVGVAGVLVAALAVIGVVQWRSAETSKSEVDSLLTVSQLIGASEIALASDDAELALLYAVQAVHETVDLGFADEDAIDAVHWALQERGVQYSVEPDTQIAVRSGPSGLAGVYVLPPAQLVEFAEESVDRNLTDAECAVVYSGPCSDASSIPADLPLRLGDEAYGASEPSLEALRGTTVAVAAAQLREEPGLVRELDAFTEATGISIDLVSNTGEGMLAMQSGEGELPDAMAFGNVIPAWAADRVLDLTTFLDHSVLRADFGDEALTMRTSDNEPRMLRGEDGAFGVPMEADVKGLVFYPKEAFDDAGLEVPESWDELMALSTELVARGETPWCMAFASGFPFDGWPGTDLLEALVLRTAGVETYDNWASGVTGFSDPAIADGARLAEFVMSEPGFVRGGTEAVSSLNFTEQMFTLLARDNTGTSQQPGCWFYLQGDFMLGILPPGAVVGQNVDYFPLPGLEAGVAPPLIGSVTSMIAVVDRPEVRAFLEHVASPEWGAIWATEPANGFISLNARFDTSVFDVADDPSADVRRRLFTDSREALQSGTFRRDASDQMPPEVGGWIDEPPTQGAFYAGMTDWVDGVRSLDQVLVDIDTRWAELRADGS